MPPIATAAREANASACIFMMPPSARLYFGGIQHRRKPLLFAVITCAFPEPRPSDPGRMMASDDLAVGILADQLVKEYVLRDDGVAFHAHHLGDVGDAPRAVAQTGGLDNDVDRGTDHLANGARGQREAAHRDHR